MANQMTGVVMSKTTINCITAWLALIGALALGGGCAGTSEEVLQRSQAQFRLAATMHNEGSNRAAVIQHLQNALEIDPENARAYLLLGVVLVERGNLRAGIPEIERSVTLFEEQGPGAALAEARNVLGATLLHAGRLEEAAEVLESSAEDLLNTSPHLALGNLGLVYFQQDRLGEARQALRESVQQQERFCLGYFRLGMVLFADDEFELAEQALTRAVSADPSCEAFQDAYKLRGEVYARLELSVEAVEDMETCLELGPRTDSGRFCARFLEGIR